MPASDTIASVIVAASSGERWFKPASAGNVFRVQMPHHQAMTVNAASTVNR